MDAKRLKKLLAEDPAPLPPELAWERMEAGIEKKMAALQTDEAVASGTDRHRKWYRFGLLLLLLIPLVCTRWTATRDGAATVGPNPGPGLQLAAFPLWPADTVVPARIIADNRPEQDRPTTNRAKTQSIPSTESEQGYIATATPTGATPGPVQLATPGDNRASQTVFRNDPDPVKSTRLLPSAPPAKQRDTPTESVTGRSTAPRRTIAPVAPLPPRSDLLALAPAPLPSPTASAASVAPSVAQHPLRQFGIQSGLTHWRPGYGDRLPERQPHETQLPSFYAALDYTHSLGREFTWSVGLQYQQLEHRFDWSTEVEDYTVTLTDTILRVNTNSLTGQQTIQRGDVTVNVPARRTIRHYNNTRLFQTQLAVGKIWNSRSWQSEVALGGALAVYTRQGGRTLYQAEIFDYSGTDTDFSASRWRVSALARGRLSYWLTQRLGLSAGIRVQQFLNNWSTEENTVSRPILISGGLGVNYRF